MKAIIPTLATLVALNVAAGNADKEKAETDESSKAQAVENQVEQVTQQVEQAARQVERRAEQIGREIEKRAERWGREIEKRAERFAKSFDVAQAGALPADPPEPVEPADLAEAAQTFGWDIAGGALNMANDMVGSLFGGPARVIAQPLVIRGADTDPATIANLQEDLTVMSRILNKKIEGAAGRRKQDMAMGITLSSMGGPRQPQTIYLDGYGALFLLNVKFPLVAPPPRAEKEKAETPADSDWEKTKRELYGSRDGKRKGRLNVEADQPGMEFDPDKVEKLTNDLLESLKNAANIRHLKPDDYVAVAVAGGGGASRGNRVALSAGGPAVLGDLPATGGGKAGGTTGGGAAGSVGGGFDHQGFGGGGGSGLTAVAITAPDRGGRKESTLTIRVKKADLDRFAKDQLTLEEFRKKAAIQAY